MIRDRGNIKWTAMMLPEHLVSLREWMANEKKTEKPQLDDYELELIADEITRAYQSKSGVKLTYWRDGYIQHDYGVVIEINTSNQSIVLDDPFTTTRYPFNEITAVSLIDSV